MSETSFGSYLSEEGQEAYVTLIAKFRLSLERKEALPEEITAILSEGSLSRYNQNQLGSNASVAFLEGEIRRYCNDKYGEESVQPKKRGRINPKKRQPKSLRQVRAEELDLYDNVAPLLNPLLSSIGAAETSTTQGRFAALERRLAEGKNFVDLLIDYLEYCSQLPQNLDTSFKKAVVGQKHERVTVYQYCELRSMKSSAESPHVWLSSFIVGPKIDGQRYIALVEFNRAPGAAPRSCIRSSYGVGQKGARFIETYNFPFMGTTNPEYSLKCNKYGQKVSF